MLKNMYSNSKLVFLENPREVSFEWHYKQAKSWLEYNAGRELDNILIYASFELRCMIKRLLFETLFALYED